MQRHKKAQRDTERDRGEREGDSKAGRYPEAQRLSETPRDIQRQRQKEKGEGRSREHRGHRNRERDKEMPRGRDTQRYSEIHRNIYTQGQRDGWEADGDSTAVRGPKTQRLRETPETQRQGGMGDVGSTGDMKAGRD